jgi:hypothetical protein
MKNETLAGEEQDAEIDFDEEYRAFMCGGNDRYIDSKTNHDALVEFLVEHNLPYTRLNLQFAYSNLGDALQLHPFPFLSAK